MASLSEALQAPQKRQNGTPCTVGLVLKQLGAADKKALLAALADPTIHGTFIGRQITANSDADIKGVTIQRHRRGDCLCR
jgi:hypothetical protein